MAISSTPGLTQIAIASADEAALSRLRRAADSLNAFSVARVLRGSAALRSYSDEVEILGVAGPADMIGDMPLLGVPSPQTAYFFVLLGEEDYALAAAVGSQTPDGVPICAVADSSETRLAAALLATAESLLVTEPADSGNELPVFGNGWRTPPSPVAGPLPAPRELQVLGLLAAGMSNGVIASELGISENTVKFHLASIYHKFGVRTRTEAVYQAVRRGLIPV